MDFESQIVPAAIILLANLLSGPHASIRWEKVTAIFGWGAAVSLVAYFILIFVAPIVSAYAIQVAGFCLITALSRDYEKILRPLFPWNRN